MIKLLYLGWFYERSWLLMFSNIIMWLLSAVLLGWAIVVVDEITGSQYIEKGIVEDIEFVPKHAQLVGKAIIWIDDEWFITTDTGVTCNVPLNYFNIGDEVEISYNKGSILESKYCNTIKKIKYIEG